MPALFEFTETKLHAVWAHRAIPPNYLKTEEGRELEIVNPGIHNSDSGPDFRRATLRLAGKLLEGDVECHLAAGDWEAHGHHRDPAYNNVILHLALAESFASAPATPILRENGLTVPQLLLPENFLREVIIEETPLRYCPLSETSAEKISATVQHAGMLRLQAKTEAFAEQVAHLSWDQAVYRGIAEALGYDKNQEPFRKLAELLPVELLFAELRGAREHAPAVLLEALLFGAAGFLAENRARDDAETTAYFAARKKLWEELRHTLQIRPLALETWHFFRLRPQNFPTRRLAALGQLILKFYRQGIVEHLAATVQALGNEPNKLAREILQYFLCPAEGFWQTHYDLFARALSSHKAPGDLLGRERALDIASNIVLPALYHYFREAGDGIRQNQVCEAYARFPKLQENRITRAMREQLSRKHLARAKVAGFAREQQGLIHLQKLYCRALRCEECLRLVN